MNKKADFESILYGIISIVVIGIIIFVASHMNLQIYNKLDNTYFNNTPRNDSQAALALDDIRDVEGSRIWDYGFLAVFIGVLITLGLTGYAVRISPVFYWIYAILSLIVLLVGVFMSNAWQEFSSNSEFSATITRFPITNSLLGTYYPTVATAVIVIVMILLFAKTDEGVLR